MATDFQAEVVRYLRRRKSNNVGDFNDITWLGAEQRFVNALRNSKVNNLEEQYITGTDTYTVTWQDDDHNDIIEKSFCVVDVGDSPDTAMNYYKLKTTIYNVVEQQSKYIFVGDSLEINTTGIFEFGTGTDDQILFGLDPDHASFDQDNFIIDPKLTAKVREDNLYFVRNNNDEELILTKNTYEIKKEIDGKQKTITYEQIINHINPSV